MTEDIFKKIEDTDKKHDEYLRKRKEKIEKLKKRDKSGWNRKRELKQKAKRAKKFTDSPHWKYWKEYIQDLQIEIQIKMEKIGLKNKSNKDIGREVNRLATRLETLDRAIERPKKLLKLLK